MNILKQSWKKYKEKFAVLAVAQLALFFSSLFFLIFVKGKLSDYLQKIKEFQPIIEETLNTINVADPASIANSTTLIDSLNALTSEALLFATIIVPIILLLIWISFQALFWSNIKTKKIKSIKHYLIKLAVPSILVIGTVNYLGLLTPENLQNFYTEGFQLSVSKLLTTIFFALYFLTVYYATLDNQKITHAIKRTFKLSIMKFYKFIPLYIPLFINTVLILSFMAIAVTQEYVSTYIYIPKLLLILLIVLTLNISKFYKILFQKIIDRN